MLTKLELIGYRGFKKHSFELRALSIAVGYNNAGKSTIVEVLRILGVLTERLGGLNFISPPHWTELPMISTGVSPSLDGLDIQFQSISNGYTEDFAQAIATFSTGERIHLYVSAEARCFALLTDSKGNKIKTKAGAKSSNFPSIQVLPQITPLDRDEVIRSDSYIRKYKSTALASRHFRNQLRLNLAAYKKFRGIAEETWPGIQIKQLEGAMGKQGEQLSLMIRDREFVAEVCRMGHGLQMWLQTIWFVSRANINSTVVLDEPDVYMHPDLQRKLIRYIKNRFPQVIVATHSVEIVAEVEPSEVLVVDRKQSASRFADTLDAVQQLIENIGGIHNVHLARLWNSRRCILVEGKDLEILKRLHDKLFPDTDTPLDDIPNSAIGGWSGWQNACGQKMFAKNALGESLIVYCILDSDYHTEKSLDDRRRDAIDKNVELHIWSRKEIENYLISLPVITRIICKRNSKCDPSVVEKFLKETLNTILKSQVNVVFDNFASSYRQEDPGRAEKANGKARNYLGEDWEQHGNLIKRVCGKFVLKELSSAVHEEFNRGFSIKDVVREMEVGDIEGELREVLTAIEETNEFA